jgi:hypothetical protein
MVGVRSLGNLQKVSSTQDPAAREHRDGTSMQYQSIYMVIIQEYITYMINAFIIRNYLSRKKSYKKIFRTHESDINHNPNIMHIYLKLGRNYLYELFIISFQT